MANLNSLTVELGAHTYPIYVGVDLFNDGELLRRHLKSQQILIVTNATLAPLYLAKVQEAFSAFQCDVLVLPDGEAHKNQQSLFMIYEALTKHHHHRDTTLIALGGGVVGDLTGFAAATYQRGVQFIQMPTTLLADVDASIGGKTAINYLQAKNMIGCFYQPHAVIMDLKALQTLPIREFRAGLGEVIKYALLSGESACAELSALMPKLTPNNTTALSHLICECCQIKARFVALDERETGERALLNLGHTFAHALESYTNYTRWLHGEAVAIGLYCAALLSHQLGHLKASALTTVDLLLKQAKLPRRIPDDIDLTKLQALMLNDKKIKDNQQRFILMKGLGACYIEDAVPEALLRRVLICACLM